MKGVSAILITKNEERNIADCLASLVFADEIVVMEGKGRPATVSGRGGEG
jgi:glycosyltransferase involved in cell wall biosynthesis